MGRITSGIKKIGRKIYIDRDWLYEQYIILQKAPNHIAKENGIGTTTIFRQLDKHKIPKRNHKEAQLLNKDNPGHFQKGHKKGFTGKNHTSKAIYNTRIKQLGKKNHQWKGDKVSYFSLHKWIHRHKKREYFCFICNEYKKYTHFANINNEYKRDLKDYIEVCISCHRLLEKLLKRLGKFPVYPVR